MYKYIILSLIFAFPVISYADGVVFASQEDIQSFDKVLLKSQRHNKKKDLKAANENKLSHALSKEIHRADKKTIVDNSIENSNSSNGSSVKANAIEKRATDVGSGVGIGSKDNPGKSNNLGNSKNPNRKSK